MKPEEIKETNVLVKQAKNNSRTRYETFKKEKENDIAVLKEMGYTKEAKILERQLYYATLHYKYSMC